MTSLTRSIIVLVLCLLASSFATALDLDANIDMANSSIANGITVDADGNGTADLSAGDTIAISVVVSNAPMDVITAIFSSLVYDTTQLTFAGGAFSDVLTEASCTGFLCSPATLAAGIPAPIMKPNSPFAQATGTEDWIQALAHANVNGAMGTGPDQGVLLAFTVDSNLGTTPITIANQLTAGDVIGTSGGAVFMGTLTTHDVTINVPEPNALAASLTSLACVGLIAMRRRRAAP
ncbi:MAG TPA: PEP-CTERM sorting domain-containing protein [Deltaproteobacteria bacterium]|nr:PEP-CTERM sorting domain-containing protein [Deltaproteobacteria bacterium]